LIPSLDDDEIAHIPGKRRSSAAIRLAAVLIDGAGSRPPLVFTTVPLYLHR